MENFEKTLERCGTLSDAQLTEGLKVAVKRERQDVADILAHLAEFDKRDLSGRKGFPSLFAYCTRFLRLSKSAAGRLIAVARKADLFPSMGTLLQRGELHLVGAAMLASRLTSENHRSLLNAAAGKSEDEIERLVALLKPEPRKRDVVRACVAPPPAAAAPASQPAASEQPALELGQPAPAAPPPPAQVGHYRLSLDVSRDTMTLLNRARDLVRRRVPGGEYDGVIRLALEAFLEKEDRSLRRPVGRPRKPKPLAQRAMGDTRESRYIPEHVKQRVWERDCGRCTFVGEDGHRCGATQWLEYDHVIPRAWNGSSDDPANIVLLCRDHNLLRARELLGELVAEAFGRPYGWGLGTSFSRSGLEPSKRQIQASST